MEISHPAWNKSMMIPSLNTWNKLKKYGSRSDDELAEHDSVKQIRSDESISPEEEKGES